MAYQESIPKRSRIEYLNSNAKALKSVIKNLTLDEIKLRVEKKQMQELLLEVENELKEIVTKNF